jgi:ceramide glucosyltransferase
MAAPVHLHALAVIAAVVTVASIAYCVLATTAGVAFRCHQGRASPAEGRLAPISILKPLKGADPEMYEALRSHCLQDYPEYEILFGITEANDTATPLVERLVREFPQTKIRLVLCERRLGANGKVSSLIQLAGVASSDYVLINDSDIRVDRDYLRNVICALEQPNTGLVTCLYRGVPSATLGSRLEALGISTDFIPGVLAANLIEGGLHFGLGSTLALRKRHLEAIGGFEAIADYLADDYELGRRIAERKLKVRFSASVIETHLPAYDFSGFLSHQLRWARTIRASRPRGYVGLLLTFTLPWALACLLLSRGAFFCWALLGAALLARGAMAAVSTRLVLCERGASWLWLLPLRDLVSAAVWLSGWLGNSVIWRGEKFVLRNGKLMPM